MEFPKFHTKIMKEVWLQKFLDIFCVLNVLLLILHSFDQATNMKPTYQELCITSNVPTSLLILVDSSQVRTKTKNFTVDWMQQLNYTFRCLTPVFIVIHT